jgi:hypothetical protein
LSVCLPARSWSDPRTFGQRLRILVNDYLAGESSSFARILLPVRFVLLCSEINRSSESKEPPPFRMTALLR